jgi:hypothetical protein
VLTCSITSSELASCITRAALSQSGTTRLCRDAWLASSRLQSECARYMPAHAGSCVHLLQEVDGGGGAPMSASKVRAPVAQGPSCLRERQATVNVSLCVWMRFQIACTHERGSHQAHLAQIGATHGWVALDARDVAMHKLLQQASPWCVCVFWVLESS